jgi:hypothetical protein
VTFYHGGYGGLSMGDMILPPTTTDRVGLTEACQRIADAYGIFIMNPKEKHYHQPNRVYVTESYDVALEFAVYETLYPWTETDGSLYRVTPLGKTRPDPAFWFVDGYATLECESALIDEVLIDHAHGKLPPDEQRGMERLTKMYARWVSDHPNL